VSASAALGTVAVERIVDGLLISLVVFGTFFALRGPGAPGWMMPTAYTALGVFAGALVFILFAMWRPEQTVRFCLKMSLLPRIAPRIARVIEVKVLDMIRGFAVLKDGKQLAAFLAWSIVYWTANALGVWVLALAFGLPLSLVGGFAVMGLVGVGISLPNSPGLVGQFQWFTLLGLSLYIPAVMDKGAELHAVALAYAITQHLLQVSWYVTMGALGIASPWVSFADLKASRKRMPTEEQAPEVPAAQVVAGGKKLARVGSGGDDSTDAPAAG
jgi:hypothetical protein